MAAQFVDGAMGMAYGLTASSLLMSFGVPPAVSSATVHAAECFTTGASGISHRIFGNIDKQLFRRLVIPGMAGAVVGAYLLVSLPGEMLRPWISVYLMVMGGVIIYKAFGEFPPRQVTTHIAPLGFFGAGIDAIGGGGWGPIVSSTLIARGNHVRETVGSVNAAEFFVTFAASMAFLATLDFSSQWMVILGLATGGLITAPLGAWACRKIPPRPMMIGVGALIIFLSLRTLVKTFMV